MKSHQTDPSVQPYWERDPDVGGSIRSRFASLFGWTLVALVFGGSVISSISSGGPVAGPWWWVGIASACVLVNVVGNAIVRRSRAPRFPTSRLFAIQRRERPPREHWFAPITLSARLLRRAFDVNDNIRLSPIWLIVTLPLAVLVSPEAIPAAIGAFMCGDASAYLPVLGWCHDAMAFAELRTWPPVAPNVTVATGIIVVTKAAVWLSVALSSCGVAAAIVFSWKTRKLPASPVARRRLVLWSRLNSVRPVPLFVVGCSLIALYDTIVRLAFYGSTAVAPPVVTSANQTAFVMWAIAGAVIFHLVAGILYAQIIERRIDTLLGDGDEPIPLFSVE
ncbi:hypothetical protein LC586_34900 [Nostoc sp. CHAB 5714]|uniref:Uncharacterized protein n=1 Tax=Nostoc favosum CHAB5714 TaxID=2780399 RepID=A0ABS8IK19_9NOSO|nr:hypothetical protein [Nostoc favosum CHAB5714]